MAETFPQVRRQKHVLYPDTIRVLDKLRSNYALGLLSNGAPDLQRTKIEGAGLAGCFDEVLISGEAGVAKPDRHAFEIMLTRLKSVLENTLMIGDRLVTDIQNAQNVGMRAVWINRSGKAANAIIKPDWEISSLDEQPYTRSVWIRCPFVLVCHACLKR